MQQGLDSRELNRIIAAALKEDAGDGDITSELTIPKTVRAEMTFVACEPLVACGLFIPEAVFAQLGKKVRVRVRAREGRYVKKGTVLAVAGGDARALLLAERTILNFMQRLSGVATLTRQYADAVKGTKAVILDTRKTLPGFRMLDKYAVRTGGGENHRMRLDDMVLIKDNHIAIGIGDSGFGIGGIIAKVRKKLSSRTPNPQSPIPIVVECDTLAQVREALAAKPDRILLDNMTLKALRAAVKLVAGRVPLEASGGISLENVRAVAETGVGYISVGRLTHSAPAADIRADIKVRF